MNALRDIFGAAEEIGPAIFAARTIIVGLMLFVEGRFLPHRSGGQFAGYDFAFFWMMGGLTAAPLFEAKISVTNTVVVVSVVYLMHYLISYLAVRNRMFAKIVLGQPIPLILGGKVIRHNMAKAFFPLELLLSELRAGDAPKLGEIEAAILETSGHVSVLKKSDYQPVTPADLKVPTPSGAFPSVLISDGKVIKQALSKLGYDENWLNDQLLKEGIADPAEVYVAAIDSSGHLYTSVKT